MFRQTKDFLQLFAACNRLTGAVRSGDVPSENDLKYVGLTTERFKALSRTR